MFRGASEAWAVPIDQVKWLIWAGVVFHFAATAHYGPFWRLEAAAQVASADGSCSYPRVAGHITLCPCEPTMAHGPVTCAAQVRHHDPHGVLLVLCPWGVGPDRRGLFCWSGAAPWVPPGPD